MTDAAARALDALGNPIRRQIVHLLGGGPRPVGAIADTLPVSRPAVSAHLRVLEEAALVTFEKAGNRNLFRLRPEGFAAARDWLGAFWDDALIRFTLLAENTAPATEPAPTAEPAPATEPEPEPERGR